MKNKGACMKVHESACFEVLHFSGELLFGVLAHAWMKLACIQENGLVCAQSQVMHGCRQFFGLRGRATKLYPSTTK